MSSKILPLALTILCLSLTGCIAVGYSSASGWHVGPGPFSLLVAVLLVVFLLRRRR